VLHPRALEQRLAGIRRVGLAELVEPSDGHLDELVVRGDDIAFLEHRELTPETLAFLAAGIADRAGVRGRQCRRQAFQMDSKVRSHLGQVLGHS
jgi:hypothetical protein